jgi:hypothetical protein
MILADNKSIVQFGAMVSTSGLLTRRGQNIRERQALGKTGVPNSKTF